MSSPLVSYCLVTYNQEDFVRDAVQSAFDQRYDNLEIIISDDCSSDNTISIIEEMIKNYDGPHKIIFNKNNPNLGIRENFNKILYQISKGEYILLAGGDDISDPNRTQEYVDCFESHPDVMSISCKSVICNEKMEPMFPEWEWDNSYSIFTINDYINFYDLVIFSGDSRGLRRKVIDSFEPLKDVFSEDFFLFVRSMLVGSFCYMRKPLVKKRVHAYNVSNIHSKDHSHFKNQIYRDIDTAFDNGFITKTISNEMKRKIDLVMETNELYSGSKFSSPKAFLYYVLSRLFKVRKVRK